MPALWLLLSLAAAAEPGDAPERPSANNSATREADQRDLLLLLDDGPLTEFKENVARKIIAALESVPHAEDTVVAISGVASLFGFLRISEVLPLVESHIRGRLLVFFPGVYEQDNYRLLDARDGWNYHAVPITPAEGDSRR